MTELGIERRARIREQKEELRKLAIGAESYESFKQVSDDLVRNIDIFALMEEFRSQGGESLATYYKNIRGE